MKSAEKVPAIVLGADITALGVIRILSRQKIKTYFISDKKDFAQHSRWSHAVIPGIDPLIAPEDLARLLDSLELKKAVLFPCSDNFLEAVIDFPAGLKTRYLTSLPPPVALDSLVNKGKFAVSLMEAGIPHPETVAIDSADKLRALDKMYFKGYFLKPFHSKQFQLEFQTKAFRVSSLEDALEKFAKTQQAGQPVMLQEYIPGSANQHYFVDGFVDSGGEIRALFVRRRERIFPPDFGNSSYCVSVPPDAASSALESVRKLMKYLGYRGIFSAEFKYDERDKLFKILEVNARPWWYIEFACQCGVDTCQMAYRDALGMSVESVAAYKEGLGCMYSLDDLRAAAKMFSIRGLSFLTWIKQFVTAKKPIFSWDDPFPAVYAAFARSFRFFKKRFVR